MKRNIGTTDKIIRLIIAVIVAGLYFTNVVTGTASIGLMVLAGVFLLTVFISVCPFYIPFGISTHIKKA